MGHKSCLAIVIANPLGGMSQATKLLVTGLTARISIAKESFIHAEKAQGVLLCCAAGSTGGTNSCPEARAVPAAPRERLVARPGKSFHNNHH